MRFLPLRTRLVPPHSALLTAVCLITFLVVVWDMVRDNDAAVERKERAEQAARRAAVERTIGQSVIAALTTCPRDDDNALGVVMLHMAEREGVIDTADIVCTRMQKNPYRVGR